MARIVVRIIDEKTKLPVEGARVFICKNSNPDNGNKLTERVFANNSTDAYGKIEVDYTFLEDTEIFIRVRGVIEDYYIKTKEYVAIVDKKRGLDLEVEVQEDLPYVNNWKPSFRLHCKSFFEDIIGFLKCFFKGET
jgi:hypothetical protein